MRGGSSMAAAPAAAALSFLALLLASGSAAGGAYGYEATTTAAGLTYRHASDGTNDAIYTEIMGSGGCVLDHDGDGWEDLFLPNSRYREDDLNAQVDPRAHLYRNRGDGTFEERAVQAGADLQGWFYGCTAGDYDGDGDVDLYATAYGKGALLRNEGNGTFTDVTDSAGVGGEWCGDVQCFGASAAWLDIEGDGDLDLYRVNYLAYDIRVGGPTSPGFYAQQDAALWRNNGNGTFTDIATQAGVTNINGNGLGIAIQDYDGDGDQDIFVANDETPDSLYENRGNASFLEQGPALGVDDGRGGMGTSWGDYDLDGRPDLVITHYFQERFALYHHEPGGGFTDQAETHGLGGTRDFVGWGAEFVDVDNDGWPDLVLANGHVSQNFSLGGGYGQRNLVYLNEGGTFRNATADMGAFDTLFEVTRGLAALDYDEDGHVDFLAVNNANQTATLLRSLRGPGNFLTLALRGDPAANNRDALGAVVEVQAGGRTLRKEVASGGSYLSQSSLRVHAGLGAEEQADVTVTWPDGSVRSFPNMEANRIYTLEQGGQPQVRRAMPLVRAPASASSDVLTDITLEGEVVRMEGEAVSHSWDLGDGTVVQGRVASHRYAANGDYVATYRATDAQGRWDEATVKVRVVNVLPEASFTGPIQATRLDTLTFDGSASSDADGALQAWRWEFGDGTTATGAVVEHRYASLGNFTVTLEVEDADGATARATSTVVVRNLLPKAMAGPDRSGNNVSPVTFDGSASRDPDGTLVAYFWDFGDGSSGQGVRVEHTYPNLGTYTATLTVVDNDGGTHEDVVQVAIVAANAPPFADAGPDRVADRVRDVVLDGGGSRDPEGGSLRYTWDLGDGTTAEGRVVAHRYATLGTFTVTLTVQDEAFATGTDTALVEVRNLLPTARPGPDAAVEGLVALAFDGSASSDPEGPLAAHRWDFTDGASAHGAVVQHAFATYGRHAATLTVTDQDGAQASAQRKVWVYARPVARAGPDHVTDRLTTLTFDGRASSDADGRVVAWAWDFGDGRTAQGPVVQHRFTALGFFQVRLTVTDDDGFTAVDEAVVEVRNIPPVPVLRGWDLANLHQGLAWKGGSSWDPDGFVAKHAWDFGEGWVEARNPNHAFTALGEREVVLEVVDNDGAVARAAHRVEVVDWLRVDVAMDKDEWGFQEDITGSVVVRFANGEPLRTALQLNLTYKVKVPRLNGVPEEVDVRSTFLNLTTGHDGAARFTVPSDAPPGLERTLPRFHLPTLGHEAVFKRHMGSYAASAPVAWQGNRGVDEARFYVRTNDLDIG
jgi:enediyne biosynthesis protein E4